MLEAGGTLRIRAIDIEYLEDARAGDELVARSWLVAHAGIEHDGNVPPRSAELAQTLVRADGRTLLRSKSSWVWRRRPPVLGGVPIAET
jgi:hypothetical protein